MPLIHEPSSSPPSRKSLEEYEQRAQRIRIKNRRKLYLDRHPSYFENRDLELADPLLYDRCIRRFQTATEREADGKARGYSGVLEADLYRSEAKLAALQKSHPHPPPSSAKPQTPSTAFSEPISQPILQPKDQDQDTNSMQTMITKVDKLIEEDIDVPRTKEEGLERWKWEMTIRFLRGGDEEFEYGEVDGGQEVDEVGERDEEEKWFDEEEPEWLHSSDDCGAMSNEQQEGKKGPGGETGIQDF